MSELLDLDAAAQAKKAILYFLTRCRDTPELGYYMVGTESNSLLTEAAATLLGEPVEKVRERFRCRKVRNPETRDAVEACQRIAAEHAKTPYEISVGAIEDAVAAIQEGEDE